ncbi:MAG: replicative DNA helicase [Prevotellaceae bacterium]|jgi:replicative DNA helicase|nr:replicative DNA helicase [Prevotellaceae bacterium]
MKKQTTQAKSTNSSNAAALQLGLIPPQMIKYEEIVIGSILCGFVDFNEVVQILSSEMFYKEAHGKIFAAIEKLYSNSEPIDANTITAELKKTNELDEAGGEVYIVELTNKGVSARIEYYSLAIFECYLRRELITVCNEVQKLSFDTAADFGEVITQTEKRVNDIILQIAGKKDVEHISTIADTAVEDAFKRIKNARNNKFTGVDTGLFKLNKLTCGWQPSKLYILAARPSVGKTSVMLHLARAAAKDNKKVLIFSLEMSGVELANKLLLAESEINVDRFKSGYVTSEEEAMINSAFGCVGSLPIWIDTTADITMNEIHARAKAMQKKGKCDIVLIDYLGLCREKAHAGRTREQAVSAMSREAKITAKDLQVPVILLSQLSREVEKRGDKQPQLSDLRDSGGIEQDADVVMFIWRPDENYLKTHADAKGCGKILIRKNRDGACGSVPFRHNDEMTKIYDY